MLFADLLALLAGHGDAHVASGPSDPHGCDLVFNATPLAMNDDDPVPVDVGLLDSSMCVGDVTAGHGATPFIEGAQAAGCLTADGGRRTADGGDMVEAVQDHMADFMPTASGHGRWTEERLDMPRSERR